MAPRRCRPRRPPAPYSLAAPIEAAQPGRAAGNMPVAAQRPHPRGFGARHHDVRRNPVAAVADDDGRILLLAADRGDHAVDDFRDLEDARLALDRVVDAGLAHPEEAADQDL